MVKSDPIQIIQGSVFHSRTLPASNRFSYPHFNLLLDIDQQAVWQSDLSAGLTIVDRDFGLPNSKTQGLRSRLFEVVTPPAEMTWDRILLQTMPRMVGYVFNPVSFWYFINQDQLVAVLCEVNNTFSERHFYWIYQDNQNLNGKWIKMNKDFHVSPFMPRDGYYEFRFDLAEKNIRSDIQYFAADGQLRLNTYIKGEITKFQSQLKTQIYLRYGWMTAVVVMRIHYQALKLFLKKVPFFKLPKKLNKEVSDESSLIRS